jgi:hypothetical protein
MIEVNLLANQRTQAISEDAGSALHIDAYILSHVSKELKLKHYHKGKWSKIQFLVHRMQ